MYSSAQFTRVSSRALAQSHSFLEKQLDICCSRNGYVVYLVPMGSLGKLHDKNNHIANIDMFLQVRLATVIPYSVANALLPITDITVRTALKICDPA